MLAFSFRFIAGRYHGNPWGRHVNEGEVEWPPSPWRLMRAVVATWLRHGGEGEDIMAGIIDAMIGPVHYHSPMVTLAHKRHYMYERAGSKIDLGGDAMGLPLTVLDGPRKQGKSKLMFDAFAAMSPNDELLVLFPEAELDPEQRRLLKDVLNRMPYLGRSESWVEAYLLKEEEGNSSDRMVNILPGGSDIELMALDGSCVGLPLLEMSKGEYTHPLMSRTSIVRKRYKTDRPTGTSMIGYSVAPDVFCSVSVKPVRARGGDTTPHRCARFAMDAAALPSTEMSLAVGDRARSAAMKAYEAPSQILSGRAPSGDPLPSHGHAYFLPYDSNGDGRLDHLIVYAMDGFDAGHMNALESIDALYGYPLRGRLSMVMLDSGDGECPSGHLCPTATARRWRSGTPYMLARHPKRRRDGTWKMESTDVIMEAPSDIGHYVSVEQALIDHGIAPDPSMGILKDGPASQLLRAIGHAGLPRPVAIGVIPTPLWGNRWIDFKTMRKGKVPPASTTPYGFMIDFGKEVQGPIALGYGCHIGLGMFLPLE